MCRRSRPIIALLLIAATGLTGCHPQQPFYLDGDNDLSHYVDVATDIEYPDTQTCSLDDVTNTAPPLTIDNPIPRAMWDLKLEEAIHIALENGRVLRTLGGVAQFQNNTGARTQVGSPIDTTLRSPDSVGTIYDPAIVETAPFGGAGQIGVPGVEAALSAFDAQLTSNLTYIHNDRPQNILSNATTSRFFRNVFQQDQDTFQAQISKVTATGGQFAFRNNTVTDGNNNPTRQIYRDWNTNFEASFSQPLLRGSGVQYNRIAGPDSPFTGTGTPQFDGVMLSRINTDLSLADFEANVRNFVKDVENAYWELYFAYRNLEASKAGLASAQQTWQKVHALYENGTKGGERDKEAQAREQFFFFRAQVQQTLNDLYRAENVLRYAIGLGVADGRLIRPADEPTTAHVSFDWYDVHAEALARAVELRKQRWQIKRRELELIAARNLNQPRLDANGTYRWLGLGQNLLDVDRSPTTNQASGAPSLIGTNAFQSLTSGQFQEWQLGLQAQIPIGFRLANAGIRHFELQLARARAQLQEQELELSHLLGGATRNLDGNYELAKSNFDRRVAAENQVAAIRAAYEADTATLDLVLEAQRRRADSEVAYYRALVDYQKTIIDVHFRKGSLLEYDGVYLQEGPWPNKAYFDAERMARKRDASYYLDYGYTRPKVVSEGPYVQFAGDADKAGLEGETIYSRQDMMPGERSMEGLSPEDVPGPMPKDSSEEMPAPKTTRSAIRPPRVLPKSDEAPRNIRPSGPRSAPQLGPVLQEPRTNTAEAKDSDSGESFEWGSLGLDRPKPQSRIVNKSAAAPVKEVRKATSATATPKKSNPVSTVAPKSEVKPAAAEMKAEVKPASQPKVDYEVRPAMNLEWQSKSARQASAAERVDSASQSSGWKAVR